MTNSLPNRQRQLDGLITEIASDLMGVPLADARAAMERTLAHLIDFFSVDQTFLRSNDHEAGMSILRAEWPRREVVPVPDPLQFVPFDADPVFEMSRSFDSVFITYPEDAPDYQELVEAGSGMDLTTMAMVPLRREGTTAGILGLIRHSDERWKDGEVDTLTAIASLIAQMWGRHDAEEVIAHQALYDELTDLPNRRMLTERIDSLSDDDNASLLVVDIDNMKVVNDGLNYEAGNTFLIAMADRLRSTVRSDNLVARLSGDQFGVLVTESERRNVEALANRLLDKLGRVVHVGGVAIVRSVSIGIAHRDPQVTGMDHVDLLKDADVAMFQAKRDGKNRLAVFDDAMKQRLSSNFEMEIELRQALEANDQLCLHYQPEVDLRTGEIVAVEALMRWNHPTRGLLAAGLFIETAEESGLIVEIGDYVLRESIAQLSRWQEQNPDLIMRVNVSPAQLMSRDLASQIRSLVNEFGVPPNRMCIEVTEHVMIVDHKFTLEILNEIRAMGVQIALDDFGTGYSSMEQLKKLPIDALKIDRAFMIELATNDRDAAIVDATITLADALGLATVAEGIEEEEQVLELLQRGCNRAQGFLLAKPAPPEQVAKLFGTRLKAGRLNLSEVQNLEALPARLR